MTKMSSLRSLLLTICWIWGTTSKVSSFSLTATSRTRIRTRTYHGSSSVQLSASSSDTLNRPNGEEEGEEKNALSSQRRNLLGAVLVTATSPELYYSLFGSKKSSSRDMSGVVTGGTNQNDAGIISLFTPISSLDEAFELIDSSCDKRFLHAVVASDYQLLYQQQRQGSHKLGLVSSLETPTGSIFASLEENQLRDRPLHPSASQLVVSGLDRAQQTWGRNEVVSVWPLGDDSSKVHFAWPEAGGTFQSDSNVIVDGIDCGRMSLDDVLLQGGMQVMVQGVDQFLVVPQRMEQALLAKLRGAFLI